MKRALQPSAAPAEQSQGDTHGPRRRRYFTGARQRDELIARVPTPPASTRPLLTVKEAADYLQLVPNSVYRLVAKHQLPHRRVGGALRFDFGELEAYTRRERGEAPVSLVIVKGA